MKLKLKIPVNKEIRAALKLKQSGPSLAQAHLKTKCQNYRHEILSLKVPNIEFDFDVPDDSLMLGFRH